MHSTWELQQEVQVHGNIWAKAAALAVSENLATKEEIEAVYRQITEK